MRKSIVFAAALAAISLAHDAAATPACARGIVGNMFHGELYGQVHKSRETDWDCSVYFTHYSNRHLFLTGTCYGGGGWFHLHDTSGIKINRRCEAVGGRLNPLWGEPLYIKRGSVSSSKVRLRLDKGRFFIVRK
jgi:hypothetical protein